MNLTNRSRGDVLRSPYKLELLRLLPICFGHLEPTTFKITKNPKACPPAYRLLEPTGYD
jgi:hypothetical protein